MKNFFKIIFVTFIFMLLPIVSQAACNVVIDGEKLVCYNTNGTVVEPFVFEGTTYVPVRGVASAFDVPISWDQETKTVHLGKVGGNPVLNDEINIFYNGEQFICYDAQGKAVHPILHEGTTYLPIRGIGSLFGKNIYWDNISQTATLTTPPSDAVISYLKSAVDTTAARSDINALVTFDGTLSHNNEVFSHINTTSKEMYSPVGFSLSMFLPADYTGNVSYLGNGKYFLVVSPETFLLKLDLQKDLFEQNTPATFSSIYIYIDTKGGYITHTSVHLYAKVTYNSVELDETIAFDARLEYPDNFSFPKLPYPDKATANNEAPISAGVGEKDDATQITKIVSSYFDNFIGGTPKKILNLLHIADYNAFTAGKSTAQINTDFNAIQKKLKARYADYDVTYTIDSLVYVESSDENEKAAKAYVTVITYEGDEKIEEEFEVFLKEKDGVWYLDPISVRELYNI
ncbi:MAG: copper amine oxidase N-terminal domain-containing protein [Clostridia bacterium]|nr:copper amine oxidase N-terminal domain-containing protein [Clostridia bacterium]